MGFGIKVGTEDRIIVTLKSEVAILIHDSVIGIPDQGMDAELKLGIVTLGHVIHDLALRCIASRL